MLTIDNIMVTVGSIVLTGTTQIGDQTIPVSLTLPPDLRLTLAQIIALAGMPEGGLSPADEAALDVIRNRAEGETGALDALAHPPTP